MAKRKTLSQKSGIDKVPPILSRPLWKDRLVWFAVLAVLFWILVGYLVFG